jgi:hypothetical protein
LPISHWYGRNEARLRSYANRGLWVVAIVCLILGLVFAPFSPIPNGLNTNLGNFVANASFNLPDNLINYTFHNITYVTEPHDAQFTVVLSGGEIVAGKKLTMEITMTANPTLRRHVFFIYADPDNALIWPLETEPGTGAPFLAYVNLRPTSNPSVWKGTQTIYYAESGIFGVSVFFVRSDSYTASQNYGIFTRNLGPIVQILSPDTIIARYNEALTTSLTFFILFFAALDVRPKTDRDYSRSRKSSTEKSKRKKMV